MKNKCVIIPAYHEEEHIESVIKGVKEYSDADIIVINDGSGDLTGEKAKVEGAFIITHPFNMGYGVALQTGYKYAIKKGYDFLIQIDGDGQHDPKYIPEFFERMESGPYDLIIGSRFLGDQTYDAGLLKSIGIMIFRIIVRIMTGEKITDPTSGYQCLNKKVMMVLTDDIFPSDYPDANQLIMLHRLGFRMREIPVKMRPNPEGRSMHQGIFRLMYYFFKMFLSFFILLLKGRKGSSPD